MTLARPREYDFCPISETEHGESQTAGTGSRRPGRETAVPRLDHPAFLEVLHDKSSHARGHSGRVIAHADILRHRPGRAAAFPDLARGQSWALGNRPPVTRLFGQMRRAGGLGRCDRGRGQGRPRKPLSRAARGCGSRTRCRTPRRRFSRKPAASPFTQMAAAGLDFGSAER